MTGETRWVTVRTPQIGDEAWHRTKELDPRPVVATEVRGTGIWVRLDILGSPTQWLPASNYTFKRAELVPDTEPTDAEVAAFKEAWQLAHDTELVLTPGLRTRAGLRAVLALRAEQ